jgi:hypothetical protein
MGKGFKHLKTQIVHKPGAHIRSSPIGMPSLDKMPLISLVNSRGGGKTTLASHIARTYNDCPQEVEPGKPVFDRFFILSPTYEQNEHVWKFLSIDTDDVYLEPTQAAINDIMSKIEEDFEDYKEYKEQIKRFDNCMKQIKSEKCINSLDIEDLLWMFSIGFKKDSIKNKYDREQPPCFMLIVDDCSHSRLYSGTTNNQFINLCLRNRHYNCMIMNCTQSWKSGMPKALRQNSSIIGIGRLKDEHLIKDIYDEVSDDLSWPEFRPLFEKGTEDPYTFFMILQDFPREEGKYRKNLDEILSPAMLKNGFEGTKGAEAGRCRAGRGGGKAQQVEGVGN